MPATTGPVPRFFTPRNLERRTLGPEVAAVMVRLGYEPMPWQRQVLDVAYELDEEATDAANGQPRLWYREHRVTVPRQSGKTTETLARHVDRHTNGRSRGWGVRPVTLYLAQSATDARDKMIEEWAPILEDSPYLNDLAQVVRSNGREAIRWNPPGGRIITAPPTRKGGHGKTGVDLVDLDEAFAYADASAEQGLRPAMITRVSPQIAIRSTAGTADSPYLWGKVDDGRQRCESGKHGRVAYFEWSAYAGAPNDPISGTLDMHDPATWAACMPALGLTQPAEAMAAEHDSMPFGEFQRAYGNIWTSSVERIIPLVAWQRILRPQSKLAGRMFLAADAAPGAAAGRTAAIAVGGRNAEGQSHLEVIDSAPGLSWVADRIADLTTRYADIESVYVDPTGPLSAVAPDIERLAACEVHMVTAPEMVAACQRLHEDVMEGEYVCHLGQDALDAAVEGAAKRQLLDSWAWARRTSQSDIAPLVAVTLAHWATVTHTDELVRIR